MANAWVPDDFIFGRDSKVHHAESKEVHYQPVWKTKLPRWCPEGLTGTQRRMQRERQKDLYREEKSSKSKDHQQFDRKGKGPSADVNMVFMLPMEFLAPFSDDEEINLPDQIAQLALDPMTTVFEKPSDDERQHLKALFVKGRVDGQPVSKVLIDGGATINIMPYVMYRKLGKGDEDLTKTDMMLKDFECNMSPAKGAICVELTIDSKALPTVDTC